MQYEIRHITQFQYDRPVRESVVELRMQPRRTSGQGLVSFELEVEPQGQIFSYADSWGNAVHHFDVPRSHDRLDIIARSIVETYAQPEPLPASPMDDWARLASDEVRADCWDFLALHGFAIQTPALRAFIDERGLDKLRRSDPMTAVMALSGAVFDAFDYEAGVTEPESPIDHALVEGRGVCQDFAHIMIAICRLWGVPARYVSGYLFTDRETHDRSTSDATHAWVEAFLPSCGWIGIDPTNNVLARERHLAVAVGRDYSDVPPSRGVFKGEAESRLAVGVAVRKIKGRAVQPDGLALSAPSLNAARRRPASASLLVQHHQEQQQQQ
jgi:transglutaminase-like putative cysteine protease